MSGGTRGLPASARARRLAEIGLLVTVLIWSANFVIVKASIGALGPFTFTGLAVPRRGDHAAARSCGGGRARSGRPPASARPDRARAARVRRLPGPVDDGADADQRGRLRAADRRVAGPRRAARGGRRAWTGSRRPSSPGALIAFAGVAVVIGGSQALSLGSSLVGDVLTLGAAVLWAVYTVGASRVVRADRPAPGHDLDGDRRGVPAGAARRRGGRRRDRRPTSRPRSSSRSCTRARWPRASPTCS